MFANSQGTSTGGNGASTGGGKNPADVRDSQPAPLVAMCGRVMPR